MKMSDDVFCETDNVMHIGQVNFLGAYEEQDKVQINEIEEDI